MGGLSYRLHCAASEPRQNERFALIRERLACHQSNQDERGSSKASDGSIKQQRHAGQQIEEEKSVTKRGMEGEALE